METVIALVFVAAAVLYLALRLKRQLTSESCSCGQTKSCPAAKATREALERIRNNG